MPRPSAGSPRIKSEFADESDLWLQVDAVFPLDRLLGDVDEIANILRRRGAKVHHDIGVDVGDLRAAPAEPLESGLIDEPSCSHSFDFLEY